MLEEIPEQSELRQSWNELALTMECPEVFYTFEWAMAIQRTYRASLAPLVIAAYEGESLIGLVALATRIGNGDVVFLTADTADYCDFLSRVDRRQELVEAVLSELKKRKIRRLALANLPADSPSVDALTRAGAKCGYHLYSVPAYFCARVVLGSIEERAQVKQTVTSKKRLRRNIRELEKRGTVRIQHDAEWEKISPALQVFERAHIARFLETGRISNLVRTERRAFLNELARELSSAGWITLSRLFVGSTIAAWNYGFRYAGTWFWYQPTVNSKYGDFSPGYCLLARIIALAADSSEINTVDLGLGEEEYKHRFATANRPTLYCRLNQSSADHARAIVRHQAGAVAKASPRIESSIRAAISHLAGLKTRLRSEGFWRLTKWFVRRTADWLFGFDNVAFFEWPEVSHASVGSTTIRQLDSDLVGAAAIQYADDAATLRYLMRSAQRLQSDNVEGFALVTGDEIPVHICWAKDFEGFEMAELDRRLHAPCQNAVMIFDCFTPPGARGHGFFAEAITSVGHQLRSRDKSPWIFAAATNQASMRGIEKTAFIYKFSLGRKRFLFFSRIKDTIPAYASKEITLSAPAQ